eukprot:5583823-Pleurochrysis_carterae.AAC.1
MHEGEQAAFVRLDIPARVQTRRSRRPRLIAAALRTLQGTQQPADPPVQARAEQGAPREPEAGASRLAHTSCTTRNFTNTLILGTAGIVMGQEQSGLPKQTREALHSLKQMGYTDEQAQIALQASGGDVQRAVALLLDQSEAQESTLQRAFMAFLIAPSTILLPAPNA